MPVDPTRALQRAMRASRVGNHGGVRAVVRCARHARHGLVVGGLLLASATATGQRAVAGTTPRIPRAHTAADSIEAQAAARVASAVCDKRVVLLGELPEHGEARGFGVKARIVEHLVSRCGFGALLFESGSYDFFGLERTIASGVSDPDSLELALARAIGGLWWTRELAGMRQWLVREAVAGRLAIGGIDDQPGATSAYARATLPGLVAGALPPARGSTCREAVTRYLGWGYTASVPYDSTQRALLADCAREAAERARPSARPAEQRTPDEVMLHDAASHFARERAGAERTTAGALDRDRVMARHLAWWSARRPDARFIVWTATTHAARSSGTPAAAPLGVAPLGALLSGPWGDRMAVIGFTALGGQWARPGRPAASLASLPPDALEARALAAASPDGTTEWAYLDRAALRSMGAAPSRLFGRVTTTDWSSAFDGVLVIREEVPPTFEPRR